MCTFPAPALCSGEVDQEAEPGGVAFDERAAADGATGARVHLPLPRRGDVRLEGHPRHPHEGQLHPQHRQLQHREHHVSFACSWAVGTEWVGTGDLPPVSVFNSETQSDVQVISFLTTGMLSSQ